MFKKIGIGLGALVVLFGLFLWWGSTVETPTDGTINTTSSNQNQENDYQNFTSDKGNFSVYFEGTPIYQPGTLRLGAKGEGEAYDSHLYQYKAADESVWQVFYTEYPKSVDVSNPENVLLITVRGSEATTGGKIVSTSMTEYQGFPAIDYLIYLENEKIYFKGRNVLNGRKVYSVAYIYDEGKELPSEKFFESLRIK